MPILIGVSYKNPAIVESCRTVQICPVVVEEALESSGPTQFRRTVCDLFAYITVVYEDGGVPGLHIVGVKGAMVRSYVVVFAW